VSIIVPERGPQGPQGDPGPQGPQGPAGSGGDLQLVWNQMIPADTWEIEHNLNKYPSVTVIDSAGTQVEGDVTYIDTNNLTINFSSAFAGKASLN
jgi:hypothetical protein